MNSKVVLTIVFAVFILVSGVLYMTSQPEDHSIVYEFEEIESVSSASDNSKAEDLNRELTGSGNNASLDYNPLDESELELDLTKNTKLVVYLHGAIRQEGVYELKLGARVHEALEMAGGMKEDASTKQVNLARFLVDGESIYFPTKDEEIEMKEESVLVTDTRVDINSATKEELITLPGIGDTKARSIIAYRTLNGEFKQIEEIMNVSGIKESLFETIQSMIRI